MESSVAQFHIGTSHVEVSLKGIRRDVISDSDVTYAKVLVGNPQ